MVMTTSAKLPWPRRGWFSLSACVFLVFLADWLFFDQPVGWTLGLYFSALLGVAVVRYPLLFRRGWSRVWIYGLLPLAGVMVYRPSFLSFLLGYLGVGVLCLAGRIGWSRDVPTWFSRLRALRMGEILGLPKDASVILRRFARAQPSAGWRNPERYAPWILPLIFGCIFFLLFWLANPFFDRWFDGIRRGIVSLWDGFWKEFVPARVFFWVIMAFALWAWLHARRQRPSKPAYIKPPSPIFSTANVVTVSLLMFNLLFLFQTLSDAMYLWGGVALPSGMTYAQYAHRGAFPLLAAALLAAVFVLLAFPEKSASEGEPRQKLLMILWMVQNLALTASALRRLLVYIDVYGLSRLRLAAAVWMALVAVGLILIVWRVLAGKTNGWLVNGNAAMVLVVLYVSCFINVDGIIAWHNVKNCREIRGGSAPEIDTSYLIGLGPESLPALEWLRDQKTHPLAAARAEWPLVMSRESLKKKMNHWRSWTYRRSKILFDESRPWVGRYKDYRLALADTDGHWIKFEPLISFSDLDLLVENSGFEVYQVEFPLYIQDAWLKSGRSYQAFAGDDSEAAKAWRQGIVPTISRAKFKLK